MVEADDFVISISKRGYEQLLKPTDGKGLHWTSDISDELPIKMKKTGAGSETPITMCELFQNAV